MTFFEELLTLLHPFMPFITEELWQAIRKRNDGGSIMVTLLESPTEIDETFLQSFAHMQEVISGIRSIRLGKNIPQKEALTLEAGQSFSTAFDAVIIKMGNLDAITRASEKSEGAASFMVGTDEFAVPLGGLINVEEEKAKLEADLAYQEKFLSSVMKKLANESFVSKAPEQVIAIERKKQSDAESRIATIKQSLEQLKSQA